MDLITLGLAKKYTDEKGDPGATKTYEKFVVVAVAGQSNAVGYDESPVDTKFIYKNRDTERIKQLGFYGEDNLQIIDLGYCAQSMQDMTAHNRAGSDTPGTKGIHLPLANLMLDYIPDDYGVLMLPISFGGTGFTSGTAGTYDTELKKPSNAGAGRGTTAQKWGVNTPYYNTLRDRIIHVLNLNPENLFAGIIWCQGENDKTNAAGHYSGFQTMTEALFTALNDAGLGGRTPKGTWDKDIWYNMETVAYWYSQNQCQQIWDNYRQWNENTYVEIPRDTESNQINGTGQTTSNYPSHYGNNAYQKVIAPRVLQKMIDMNTFAKKVNVVDPECTSTGGGGSSYPIATEGTRTAVQTDITTKSSVVFTIDENGNCTADQELQGKFTLNSDEQPCVYFGEIFKMEWEVKRGLYWLIIEGDIANNSLLLGIGGTNTGQLAKIENGGLTVVENANQHSAWHYTFVVGDKVRVYRNADGSLSIYRTNGANGVFQKWFEYANKNIFEKKALGFACGISSAEFNGNFSTDKNILFHGMKIQEIELYPNNKIVEFEKEDLELLISEKGCKSVIADFVFSISSNGGASLTECAIDYAGIKKVIDGGGFVFFREKSSNKLYPLTRITSNTFVFTYTTPTREYNIVIYKSHVTIEIYSKAYLKADSQQITGTTSPANCIPLVNDDAASGFIVFKDGKVYENARWAYIVNGRPYYNISNFSDTGNPSDRWLVLHDPVNGVEDGTYSYILM